MPGSCTSLKFRQQKSREKGLAGIVNASKVLVSDDTVILETSVDGNLGRQNGGGSGKGEMG